MALTVETGVGLLDADALVSVEYCTAFCIDHGLTDWTDATRSPPEDDEAAIRRTTAWLSNAFLWKGYRTKGRSQGQAFPRTDCTDGEGEEIASDEIPVEVMHACCIASAYERANPGGLSPAVTLTDRVKSERVGPMATEYASTPMSADAARPILTQVMDIIGGLLSGGSNSLVGTAVRG